MNFLCTPETKFCGGRLKKEAMKQITNHVRNILLMLSEMQLLQKKRRLFLQYVICFSSINKFFLHHTSKWMNVLSLCLGRSSWNTYSVCNELNKLWHWRRHFASNFIYLVINEAFRVWKLSRLKCLVILSTHEHTQTHELHTHVSILAPDSRFIRQFLHAATKTT